jgi:hypothetical protein
MNGISKIPARKISDLVAEQLKEMLNQELFNQAKNFLQCESYVIPLM